MDYRGMWERTVARRNAAFEAAHDGDESEPAGGPALRGWERAIARANARTSPAAVLPPRCE